MNKRTPKIFEYSTSTMSLLKAYLSKPSTQRVLSRKPGDKGFSLIELVVVVAVLAILAAIAVPQFASMNERAANAAAQTNLKNAYKECNYAINTPGSPLVYTALTDDAYFTYTSGTSCGTAASPTTITATTTATHSAGVSQTITINAFTGAKGGTGVSGITW